jgi:hypothetical protein
MALCRCLESHAWPNGRVRKYIGYLKSIGYPKTSLICGLCDDPGVIWIEKEEEVAYKQGQRIFTGPHAFTRMKADNSGIYSKPNYLKTR